MFKYKILCFNKKTTYLKKKKDTLAKKIRISRRDPLMPIQRIPWEGHPFGEESIGPLGQKKTAHFKKKSRHFPKVPGTPLEDPFGAGEKMRTQAKKVYTWQKKCVLR